MNLFYFGVGQAKKIFSWITKFLNRIMIINELSVLPTGWLGHSSKLAFLQTILLSLMENMYHFLKKIMFCLSSINSIDARTLKIVLYSKVQIFWVQHAQTARCFMTLIFHCCFCIWTTMILSCSKLGYHLASMWQEYVIYISSPLLYSH